VLINGVTGYICPVGDVACMVEKSLSILTNPSKQQEMALAGQIRAREEFGAEKIVPQYIALYEKLLLKTASEG